MRAGSPITSASISVSIMPGAIATHRMLSGAQSRSALRVKLSSAALLAP